MNRTRNALLALVAAAIVAAPLTALPAATAATAPPNTAKVAKPKSQPKVRVANLIDATMTSAWLSPNGDKAKDRLRLPYELKRKSVVTVTVLRIFENRDDSSKVLFADKVGKVARGKHVFKWDGKKASGKVAADGRYSVLFKADPVNDRIKRASDFTSVRIDTRYKPAPLEASSTAVYPNTTVITDQIAFNHGGWAVNWGPTGEWVEKVTLVVQDAAGNVVRSSPQTYRQNSYYPIVWDGHNDQGAALPAGTYKVHMDVTDYAGNTGSSPSIDVNVSAAPLVYASGTRTGAPISGTLPPAPAISSSADSRAADGRSSTMGGDDSPWLPCGSVFASSIYDGGASIRSKSACGWALNEARGGAVMSLAGLNAPRGLASAQLSMRGRPTVDGESDVAEISFGGQSRGSQGGTTKSPAAPGEAVTTTPTLTWAWDATGFSRPVGLEWTIKTYGFDCYDVADVTADFTYLTPQTF